MTEFPSMLIFSGEYNELKYWASLAQAKNEEVTRLQAQLAELWGRLQPLTDGVDTPDFRFATWYGAHNETYNKGAIAAFEAALEIFGQVFQDGKSGSESDT